MVDLSVIRDVPLKKRFVEGAPLKIAGDRNMDEIA